MRMGYWYTSSLNLDVTVLKRQAGRVCPVGGWVGVGQGSVRAWGTSSLGARQVLAAAGPESRPSRLPPTTPRVMPPLAN